MRTIPPVTIATSPNLTWDTSALYTTGTVTLTAAPEPASLALLALGTASLLIYRRRARPISQ